ncbi:hypothetical protein BDZ94DRAFT_161557 [Collybia nuda]|uniref:Uncharacterized protein n=1 Tax=Collybia nuda TaxID=64659 RepID=A0A9P5XVN7_9AGAR|nr:hypothetical protein BDZ94DRAFT_161557 [Collybia nuda]
MQNTPTQRTYRPIIMTPTNGGITPRPGHRMSFVPPRHQPYNERHNGYTRAQATGAFPSTPPSVEYNYNPGPSSIRPYRSQHLPPRANSGYVKPIGPPAQHATPPDSGSESDTSVEELWSPASGSSSIVSSTTADSATVMGYDDDTDSEDEDEPVLNITMHRQVRDGVDIFHRNGLHFLIGVLINFGTVDYPSAGPAATISRLIIKRLRSRNEQQARDLENFLRYETVRLFKDYWMPTGEWRVDKVRVLRSPYLTLKGINLAGLLGSLFRVDILRGDDVHLCLNHVAANAVEFHPLCAIHALVTHCGKKLCRRTLLPGTNRFWALMSTTSRQTGQFIWAYDDMSFELLMDVLGTLDRWLATQTLKQIRAASDPVKIAKRKKKALLRINT